MTHYDIRCALILLYDKGEVLLQKRTIDAPVLPNHWAFFGGGIESNETPKEAVIREAKEELGYVATASQLLLEKEFRLESKSGYMYVYAEKFIGSRDEIHCFEGEKLGWFAKEQIDTLKMLPHDKEVVFELFNRI